MKNSIEKTGKIYDFIAVAILIVGLALIFLIPHWFVQPARTGKFDLTQTGNIGATIGGITAPIVGFVTALLMYIAFKVQYIANSKQWAAFNSELKMKNIESISQEIESIINRTDKERVENLKLLIDTGMNLSATRERIMEQHFDTVKVLTLYIDNFIFLFNRIHNGNLEDVIKENYRLRLLRFDSHFKDYLYLIDQYFIEYEKRGLFSDFKAKNTKNYQYLVAFSKKLNPYIKNVEYLTGNEYVS